MNDLEKRLSILKSDLTTTWQKLQITQKIAKLEDLERQISEPELWQNPENAKKVNTSFSRLKSEVEPWQMLEMQTSDLQEILELQEPDLISEINDQLTSMEQTLAGLKKALRFTNQYDEKNAIIRITAGVGGTEAMDWAGMLERMYLRFFEKNNYSVELIERTAGEEAGIKTAVYEVYGNYPYGNLKSEHGVHRATNCGSRYENFRQLKEWKSVELGYEKCDVTSINMDNLIEGRSYRLVVQRSPLKDKDGKQQTDMFGVIYTYRCILTNNWTSTEKDIITFYNERGASEKNFDIQNNDFGWAHLPFSFMAENMVFMMVTAMLKNFYLYLVRHISEKVKPLKKTSRLKAFILHFVSVPAKWVRTGRQNVLNLYTNKTYYAEIFIE